jgi:hypothetical protein
LSSSRWLLLLLLLLVLKNVAVAAACKLQKKKSVSWASVTYYGRCADCLDFGQLTLWAGLSRALAAKLAASIGKEGISGAHRSHDCTVMLCTKCINIIDQDFMRPCHAECFTVTAAGRSVDPAAVPRWYKGGAYFTHLRGFREHAAQLVMTIDIVQSFCARF